MKTNIKFLYIGCLAISLLLSIIIPPIVNHEFSLINNGIFLTCMILWNIIFWKYIYKEEDNDVETEG